MPIVVNAAKTEVALVKNNAAKTEADFVKVNAAKTIAYTKSLPPLVQTFDLLAGSTVYRGVAGGISNRPDVRNFMYYGWNWNSEIERTMVRMDTPNRDALRDMLLLRPIITKIEVAIWTQHTQNSATADGYFGWHSSQGEAANFARLHSEKDAAWSSGLMNIPHNGSSGGNQALFAMPGAIFANFLATAQAGNLWGMTLTNEDATNSGTGNWGWTAGDSRCTSESGGSCNGSTLVNTGADVQRVRLEVTANS